MHELFAQRLGGLKIDEDREKSTFGIFDRKLLLRPRRAPGYRYRHACRGQRVGRIPPH